MLQILFHLPKTTQALCSPTNKFCLFAEELLCIVYESPAEERIIPDVYYADIVAYKGGFLFFFAFSFPHKERSLSVKECAFLKTTYGFILLEKQPTTPIKQVV